ncbi:MAG: hypothetical protein JNL97_06485 [Verrucomicrobiales bacterium]|nr:hypothetical protein [Verrucomicrobiales bacterium]
MNLRHLLLLPGVLLALASPAASPAAKSADVFPWCGDHAVLAADVGFGARDQTTSVSGRADDPKSVAVSFSVDPESWSRVLPRERRAGAPDGIPWELPLREAGFEARKALLSGAPFGVRIGLKQRRAEPDVLFQVRDLVVAPVWALVVDPAADDHELPSLTPFASNTVRVLSFDGGLDARHCSHWMRADEAIAAGTKNFSGLARAFANDISSQGRGVFGLVLVPRDLLPKQLPGGRSVEDWSPSRSSEDDPLLHAAVRGIRMANNDERHGARRRYERAVAAHKRLQQDAKREGRVLGAFPTDMVLWKEFHPGDQGFLPFRVNGLVR